MPERIHRIEAGPGSSPHVLDVRVDGRRSGFDLGTERLSTRLVSTVPDRLVDFLEVAAAVFAADSHVPRGGPTRPGMGSAWRRRFDFRIAVREPEFWNRDDVREALAETIDFMSEDKAAFEFERAAEPGGIQKYMEFDPEGDERSCEDVVLFSGGLDSLAGAFEVLREREGRVALVTHQSAQKRIPIQDDLAEAMKREFGDRVLWLPVRARRTGGRRPPETTQRTRSLMFAALGFTAQRMLGGERLNFFENGIVSQNLPITPQVVGAMATRTTHPRTLLLLRRLLALVADGPVELLSPYEWRTKTEVVERLVENGGAELIGRAVSCSQIWERPRDEPHCGTCSQCLDRRFAVLAAGQADRDPVSGYAVDVITGQRADERNHALAFEWTRNGRDLKDVGEAAFCDRFARELTAIVRGFPDRPGGDVMKETLDLHRKHGRAVVDALAAAARQEAETLAAGRLGPRSLVRAFASEGAPTEIVERAGSEVPPPPEGPPAERPMAGLGADPFPLQVRIVHGRRGLAIEVEGIGSVTGRDGRVVEELHPYHEADREAGKSRDEHRFVPAAELADRLGRSPNAVWSAVKRCRDELAEQYEVVAGGPPEDDLLIHSPRSRRPGGYRLDPDCRVIVRRAD